MKLLLLLILIINLSIIANCKLTGKLYQYSEHLQDWEVQLSNLPGSSEKYENNNPNFLVKTTVQPKSYAALLFIINNNEKKDVKITSSGGTSEYTYRDKFGARKGKDRFLDNYVTSVYCAKDNGAPYYFNFTCENEVFPCSISSRIDFGNLKEC